MIVGYETLNFKTADYAYWKLLIADEDTTVEKNKIKLIKIRDVQLPPHTIVSPLSIMRHGLGVVLDVYGENTRKIEEEKTLKAVTFLPIDNGTIKRGDLIGVVKVFVVGVSRKKKIEVPTVNIEMKSYDVNIVYRTNGEIVREKERVSEYWYRRWHIAEWYPLIADESLDVKPGEVELIKIQPLEIPPNTIPVPLSIMRHALGTVLDVYHTSKPKRIEDRKTVTKAVFMPVFEGRIEKGDIIGILNVYYISIGERIINLMRHLTTKLKAKLVYWENEKIKRSEIEVEPFSFKRSPIGTFEPLIASESRSVKAGKVEIIRVEGVEFPSGTIVQPLTGMNHENGIVLDVLSFGKPKLVEEDKEVSFAVFLPIKDGEVKKGDLLGVLCVYNVAVFHEPEFFLARYRNLFATHR